MIETGCEIGLEFVSTSRLGLRNFNSIELHAKSANSYKLVPPAGLMYEVAPDLLHNSITLDWPFRSDVMR